MFGMKREWREGNFPAAQANSLRHADSQDQVKDDKLLVLTHSVHEKDEIVPEEGVCRLVTHKTDTKALGESVPEENKLKCVRSILWRPEAIQKTKRTPTCCSS